MVKTSIIITTYNRPELLKRALKSAQNQTYKDYEIIVVDDHSDGLRKSETLWIVYPPSEKRVENVKLIRHEVNKGLSAARNTGIKVAKGEYIVCLDDDNELAPDFLTESLLAISNNDAVSVGRTIKYIGFEDYVVPNIGGLSSIDWGWLIRKSVFDEIQYDEAMRANEDTDFGIQFFKRFKATQLDEPLTVAYDTDDPKISLSFPTQRELDGMTYFFSKNSYEYKTPKDKWFLYRLMGRKFYRGGYKVKGLGYFLKGFKEYPHFRSFAHLFFILMGWNIYDRFMDFEEKLAAKKRYDNR